MKRFVPFLVLAVVGCAGAPHAFDAVSRRAPVDARQCVAREAEEAGFTVTRTPGEEHVLQAERVYERPDTSTFLGLETVVQKIEWGRFELLSLEESDGTTSIRYTAATREDPDRPWSEPSPYMTEFAEGVWEACS